jgi:hypothetical protein
VEHGTSDSGTVCALLVPRKGGEDVANHPLVNLLSLPDKTAMLAGDGFWSTVGVARLGIRPLLMTDGPNGARGIGAEARA